MTSCCQLVSQGWDSEGSLGTLVTWGPAQHPAPLSTVLPSHRSTALSCPTLPQDGTWGVHQWGEQDPAPHPWGCCAHGGTRLSTPFPCRVTIPLYDADTGLLVLAGKVRSHGWGV